MEKPTILIVDDLRENIDLIKTFFINEPYDFISATNGREAVWLAGSRLPDIILLDILMPGMDGFEVCKILKNDSQTESIPVIMITGMQDQQSKQKGLKLGVDDFVNKPIDMFELKARVSSLLRLKKYAEQLRSAENILYNLAILLETKDPNSRGRCTRLANYGSLLAERLGLEESEIRTVRRGGVLHDIGKLTIKDNILQKPGPLSSEEYKIIKTHPHAGEQICKPLQTLADVLPVIRSHQERFDGSGYPDGLKGNEIPLNAQIISISESFDALTNDRPYRKALTNEQAINVLEEEMQEGKWDPVLFRQFKDVVNMPDLKNKVNRDVSELSNKN